ncbi:hypothetical protein UFOVP916_8 [uncultured Caudovirales phage]|uniref:Lin1244/Lin1753-like N-terminal domain-containing protein n=1 Tax=uncultured Caudovirales phage TaxID=2100421 RepID=A0A6J5PIY3_9CAUD|nr:hypothetical protein UFOVP827_29 [uncultured Caudovirales phage]CAB4171423.1 hypothetical protein UFOVP916_8 [uncultured Caudovirales phage]CAB4177371.1 hypothetical protein UFOVP1001_32 [uncultured Caudovirales phage]CAB4199427.1 hypothetical protein UFOVP1338_44 [uncultured Caudovirales phage]CAB4213481.1 hypothetical protein UFOVP1447_39 [uncultured Caudovirales phage]
MGIPFYNMATELPYFRFTVQEWQNGNISLERYELQGLFISICGYYWMQDCSITLALLQKKFSNAIPLINELIELGILKHEKKHDKINIDFLMTQFDLLSEKRKLRQVAGSKGGNAKAMLKQKGSYKDNNKYKDKDNKITPPLIFPFDSENFKTSWNTLTKEKNWIKKSNASLQASLKKLSKVSEQDAIEMINNTIAGEWQGIFELEKNKKQNGKSINNGKPISMFSEFGNTKS